VCSAARLAHPTLTPLPPAAILASVAFFSVAHFLVFKYTATFSSCVTPGMGGGGFYTGCDRKTLALVHGGRAVVYNISFVLCLSAFISIKV
jgi:hypothetical protein